MIRYQQEVKQLACSYKVHQCQEWVFPPYVLSLALSLHEKVVDFRMYQELSSLRRHSSHSPRMRTKLCGEAGRIWACF